MTFKQLFKYYAQYRFCKFLFNLLICVVIYFVLFMLYLMVLVFDKF